MLLVRRFKRSAADARILSCTTSSFWDNAKCNEACQKNEDNCSPAKKRLIIYARSAGYRAFLLGFKNMLWSIVWVKRIEKAAAISHLRGHKSGAALW